MPKKETSEFHRSIIEVIRQVPKGKVATYGQVARIAGNSRAARQVVWCLHSSSKSKKLPWHRIINSQGKISLPVGKGFTRQKSLLRKEKVKVTDLGRVDLKVFQWEF